MTRNRQSVWITGISSGVGAALADAFLSGGWTVFGSSRARPSTRTSWAKHANARVVPMDVRRASSVASAWALIRKQTGTLDVLVNNAGVTVFKDVLRTSPAEFRDIIDTNLTGIFLTTRIVLPLMRKRKNGLIVNILSYAAKTVYTKSGAYAASKTGADMLMRVVREENRDAGIRVVNVFPGAVDTPMWSPAMRRDHGTSMMSSADVAHAVFGLTAHESTIVPEEIILRPRIGDLTV